MANTRDYSWSTGTDGSGSSLGSINRTLPSSISGQEKIDPSWVNPGYLDQVLEGYGAFVDPQTGVVMREETPGNPPVPVAFKLDGGKAGFIKNGEVIDSRLPFNDVKTGLGDYFGVLAKFGTMILGSAYLTPALTEALGAAAGGAASGAIQSTLQGGNPITGALRGGVGGYFGGGEVGSGPDEVGGMWGDRVGGSTLSDLPGFTGNAEPSWTNTNTLRDMTQDIPSWATGQGANGTNFVTDPLSVTSGAIDPNGVTQNVLSGGVVNLQNSGNNYLTNGSNLTDASGAISPVLDVNNGNVSLGPPYTAPPGTTPPGGTKPPIPPLPTGGGSTLPTGVQAVGDAATKLWLAQQWEDFQTKLFGYMEKPPDRTAYQQAMPGYLKGASDYWTNTVNPLFTDPLKAGGGWLGNLGEALGQQSLATEAKMGHRFDGGLGANIAKQTALGLTPSITNAQNSAVGGFNALNNGANTLAMLGGYNQNYNSAVAGQLTPAQTNISNLTGSAVGDLSSGIPNLVNTGLTYLGNLTKGGGTGATQNGYGTTTGGDVTGPDGIWMP